MSVEARHRPLTTSAALFALFLTGLWSGLGIAIKFGLEDAPPLRLGWLRFVLGALTVLVWALWIRADLVPKRGEALALLAVGIMFCLELATMNIGLEKTTASHAAVVLSTYSVWMAVFAHFQVPGDRLTRRKLLAVLVSYSGIVVIFVQGLAIQTCSSATSSCSPLRWCSPSTKSTAHERQAASTMPGWCSRASPWARPCSRRQARFWNTMHGPGRRAWVRHSSTREW